MLDKSLCDLLYKSLKEYFGQEIVRIDDVAKMSIVPGNGYMIFGHQYGDLTILVWIQIVFDSHNVSRYVVRGIKTQAW